ncbi:uncharacterized protein LOC122512424 [Leptopilina heterotoma]|uniref:uncharacterized protein LOC122512424 n=1 Tax=Leptopilina heterotoma TaxID=63436 RepID=UPI001CA891FB|nr:uncharacterized protein LOC122512424 [Leptopilina heterotoma]
MIKIHCFSRMVAGVIITAMRAAAHGASPNTLYKAVNHWASSGYNPWGTIAHSILKHAQFKTYLKNYGIKLKKLVSTLGWTLVVKTQVVADWLRTRRYLAATISLSRPAGTITIFLPLSSSLALALHDGRAKSPRDWAAFSVHSTETVRDLMNSIELIGSKPATAGDKDSRGKRTQEFRTARVSVQVKWRLLLMRSFSTLVRKCRTGS